MRLDSGLAELVDSISFAVGASAMLGFIGIRLLSGRGDFTAFGPVRRECLAHPRRG
jgi:hypothetical protein